jgi:hypothetical protein
VLDETRAKALLHTKGLTRRQQLLLLLAVGDHPKPLSVLKQIGLACGLRAVLKWNLSDVLRKANGLTILTNAGWELTEDGRKTVAEVAGVRLASAVARQTAADVRAELDRVASVEAREFIQEAIGCFEAGLHRAAVVFSWVGAVSILQTYVLDKVSVGFNTEARRRDPKWRDARNGDELGRMKERDFLDVLEVLGVITKSVKQALQRCLELRNSCGHPTSLKIGENNVAAHLEALTLNVYSVLAV